MYFFRLKALIWGVLVLKVNFYVSRLEISMVFSEKGYFLRLKALIWGVLVLKVNFYMSRHET